MKKRIVSFLLCFVLFVTCININIYAVNAKRPRFNKSKIVFNVQNKKRIVLKNVKRKVNWKIKNGKIIKITKRQGKFKNKIIIKAKKEGSTKIIATYNKKKYVLRVKVKSRKKVKKNNTTSSKLVESTTGVPTTKKDSEETTQEEQTTDKISDIKDELKLEIINTPIQLSDNMHIDVKISSLKGVQFITGYEFGKLEILKGNKWQPIEIKSRYAVDGLGNIMKDNPFVFSIGVNAESGKSIVHIDNLVAGHYRYSHLSEIGSDNYISGEFDIVD